MVDNLDYPTDESQIEFGFCARLHDEMTSATTRGDEKERARLEALLLENLGPIE